MKKTKKASAKLLIAYTVIATVITIACLAYLTMPILSKYQAMKSSGPIDAADVKLTELTTDQHYFIDSAAVVDGYCYIGDDEDNADSYSYVILFYTGYDQLAAASLTITPDDAIWDQCSEYLNDLSMGIGDLEFPLYGYATDVTEDSEQNSYYTEALDDFRANGISFTRTDLDFHYLGSTQAEYQDYVDSQLHDLTVRLAVIGVAVLLMIAGCIYIAVIVTKKNKPLEEDSDTIPGTPEIR